MTTLRDILSHLTFHQACKLLGVNGKTLIIEGGKYDINIEEQVQFSESSLSLSMESSIVTVALDPFRRDKLLFTCSTCGSFCEHIGAAVSLVLEEKMILGLAAPPPEKIPVEALSEEELVDQAISERKERALKEKMHVSSTMPKTLWTDYIVTNSQSGKTYRVALRGWERGESFCSCPDFRKNTLGTCKHVLAVMAQVSKKFNKTIRSTPFENSRICVYLRYGMQVELRVLCPVNPTNEIAGILKPVLDKPVMDVGDLIHRIRKIENLNENVTIYPDAEEYIQRSLFAERMHSRVTEIRNNPKNHPLRKALLKTELRSYQLDGIAFAAGAGRAIIADDMGLGKTIQGIGTAELLALETDISKVLVVCPVSLKSQWKLEIERFTHRDASMILGSVADRAEQYNNPAFFTLCNYEQVLRDILSIEKVKWDLIILDEGQRIKNWETKTSQVIKSLKSRFALVLAGTPIENRLDELYSIMEFIDDRRLGPAFRFFNTYRVIDEKGKLLGYKNIDDLRKRLAPVMIRRTRAGVMKELPPRSSEIRRITPTDEQLQIDKSHRRIIQQIISKKYISEMDMLRLQKAMLMCRMAANSTFLVDKQPPGYSSKLVEIDDMLGQLSGEEDRKIIMFSEWTTMLNLIEPLLKKNGLDFVRLDGSVPQKKRQALVHRFQNDPVCKVFITTNAGSTGLNLQAANTVINVDLPWNPAVLEQRIARAHRMGQKRPVQVFILVTESTLEENLLFTLADKQSLFTAVLDPEADVTELTMASGLEELKKRLEILLGNKPVAAVDESMKAQVESEAALHQQKERMAKAGGQLLGAAFAFIGEMFPKKEETDDMARLAETFRKKLAECLEEGPDGEVKMTITLPGREVIDNFAKSLARVIGD
ncbi:MAG: DEAD/DEAH box helicase [Desulfobacteraceae bacterium]|nr:DEAD/DEAH box helicase [Desulfobacteraceae bacterium]